MEISEVNTLIDEDHEAAVDIHLVPRVPRDCTVCCCILHPRQDPADFESPGRMSLRDTGK